MYRDRFNPPATSATSKSRSFGPTPKPQEEFEPQPPPPPLPYAAPPSHTPLTGAVECAKSAPQFFVFLLGIGHILGSCFRLGAAVGIPAAIVLAALCFVTYTLMQESLSFTPGKVVVNRGAHREYPADAGSCLLLVIGFALGLGFGFRSAAVVIAFAILLVFAIRQRENHSEP